MDYQKFLATKLKPAKVDGLPESFRTRNERLFPFQRDLVNWALSKGRACIWADCGLGKTIIQLEWAKIIQGYCARPVLILAPLAVAKQTQREGEKFGIVVNICESQADVVNGINITNYEKLQKFDASVFCGIVLDESSILKSYTGNTRRLIQESFERTPYKLACSATPSPNDYTEIGSHVEFIGVATRAEMLAMFFINDTMHGDGWRLKAHAEDKFWQWVSEWALTVTKPSDLGYSDDGFALPPLVFHEIVIGSSYAPEGTLLPSEVMSLTERREARKHSLTDRVLKSADIANADSSQYLVWCDYNQESQDLANAITEAIEITGSDTPKKKESAMLGFSDGQVRSIVTKPSIAGYGMNWQNCHEIIFCGLSDSFEQFYQALRRCYRFGQKNTVNVYIVISSAELPVLDNIKRKEGQAMEMAKKVAQFARAQVDGKIELTPELKPTGEVISQQNYTVCNNDCIEVMRGMEADSIDYSFFSPPFAALYTYSDNPADLSNCKDFDSFMAHLKFVADELYRIIKPGRIVSMHCMDLPTTIVQHGYIGLKDLPGELIRLFESVGFILHSKATINKDAATAMQRTKSIRLLYKQVKKDATVSGMAVPDYIVSLRKPGHNKVPVEHTPENFSVNEWAKVAMPIWTDIDPGDTLQYKSARDFKDEKHLTPTQLEPIRRSLDLWTNPGELVFSPFAGIGSELVVALEHGRRAYGVELKPSYFKQLVLNCESAANSKQTTLQLV